MQKSKKPEVTSAEKKIISPKLAMRTKVIEKKIDYTPAKTVKIVEQKKIARPEAPRHISALATIKEPTEIHLLEAQPTPVVTKKTVLRIFKPVLEASVESPSVNTGFEPLPITETLRSSLSEALEPSDAENPAAQWLELPEPVFESAMTDAAEQLFHMADVEQAKHPILELTEALAQHELSELVIGKTEQLEPEQTIAVEAIMLELADKIAEITDQLEARLEAEAQPELMTMAAMVIAGERQKPKLNIEQLEEIQVLCGNLLTELGIAYDDQTIERMMRIVLPPAVLEPGEMVTNLRTSSIFALIDAGTHETKKDTIRHDFQGLVGHAGSLHWAIKLGRYALGFYPLPSITGRPMLL